VTCSYSLNEEHNVSRIFANEQPTQAYKKRGQGFLLPAFFFKLMNINSRDFEIKAVALAAEPHAQLFSFEAFWPAIRPNIRQSRVAQLPSRTPP
jgi:hypothetical protein